MSKTGVKKSEMSPSTWEALESYKTSNKADYNCIVIVPSMEWRGHKNCCLAAFYKDKWPRFICFRVLSQPLPRMARPSGFGKAKWALVDFINLDLSGERPTSWIGRIAHDPTGPFYDLIVKNRYDAPFLL
jgi:hypothetical protein